MSTTATHLITDVTAWIGHEEIIVLSSLKKVLRFIDCEAETIITIGIFGAFIIGVIVRLSQLSPCAQLISCCD